MQLTNKRFVNLNVQECSDAYPKIVSNTERHYRVAQILAAENEYGNAIAHLILGTEELIKALVLCLDARGCNLRSINGMQKLFSNHQARHNLLKEFYSIWIVLRPLAESLEEYEDLKKQSVNKTQRVLHNILTVLKVVEGAGHAYLNYDWWNKADLLKQRGFYSDFNDGFISPDSITKADYNAAFQNINKFKEDALEFMQQLNDLNKKELSEFLHLFNESQLKDLMSKSLLRKKPFIN